MSRQKNLAIISPNQNVYSETFIQAHRNIDAKIFFYYGGFFPTYLEGKGFIAPEASRYGFYLIQKKIGILPQLSYRALCLKKSFKKNKIDIVLAEYGPSGVEVLPVCKALKIPLIVHFHGFDASEMGLLNTYGWRYVELFNYARKVVVVSCSMAQILIQMGCPTEKVILNPCGPDNSFFEIKKVTAKKQFLAVGRFVEKKAPYLSILAFQQVLEKIPDAKLVIAGSGILFGVCKNLVSVLGLNANVEFVGAVTPQELKKIFSESSVFIQHSVIAENGDSEGTPVAVLEASASGLPIVATRHAGIPDVVIHEKTGFLIDELDIQKMAEYMIQLITQPELAREMGNNGRLHVKENFSMKNHLNNLNKIINDNYIQ